MSAEPPAAALPSRLGVSTVGLDMRATARLAAEADVAGLDAWTSETYARSGMVSLAAMAAATERCRLGSSILYGVGRTPLVLACDTLAIDELSGGRLVLGLGNGTKRMLANWHGVDPDAPAVRMEELVVLLRRLWRLHEGSVRHEGRFYNVDISPTGAIAPPLRDRIPIYTAGINERMIEVAGRVADGLVGHPLFGLRNIDEVVRPAIARGADRAGRAPGDIRIAHMVITAIDDDEEAARREAAAQIALYAATKTYAPMLELPGFGAEGAAIREAFARRDLPAMVAAVSDDLIDALAVTGTADQVRVGLQRYAGAVDHVIAYAPNIDVPAARIERSVRALIAATAGGVT
jgi:probable F420-dependent oxidoreductase